MKAAHSPGVALYVLPTAADRPLIDSLLRAVGVDSEALLTPPFCRAPLPGSLGSGVHRGALDTLPTLEATLGGG
jgi:hypothetical protein